MEPGRGLWWLLLLAGVAVGPGWYIYARFFSGQLIGSHALLQTPAPQSVSQTVGLEQGPVGIVLKGSVGGRRFGPENRADFVVEVSQNGLPLAKEVLVFVDAKTASDAVPDRTPTRLGLAPIELERGDTLSITVTAVGAQTLTVHDLTLDIRAGVRPSAPRWLIGGALLALGAAVMLILGFRR
ncbi:hypothetical protein [Jeongeupia chitinilytica]|uniref:Uncharacterized protein n=1 Tax=Jeongeupia chitinilytica TaxID=1041641 RepID=A0ABQ3H4T6_9NEIS|nr:hypothetical protein [Jeongeupia chitinilytica]GHD66249.1 hypothetical protein GCM10007350_28260 [Jeongeupia chitinilytica]